MVETVVVVLLVGLLLAVIVQVALTVPSLLGPTTAPATSGPAAPDVPRATPSRTAEPASALVKLGVLLLVLTTQPRKRRAG